MLSIVDPVCVVASRFNAAVPPVRPVPNVPAAFRVASFCAMTELIAGAEFAAVCVRPADSKLFQ